MIRFSYNWVKLGLVFRVELLRTSRPKPAGAKTCPCSVGVLPAQHHAGDLPAHRAAFEGRPGAAGEGLGGADLPARVRVDFDPGFGLFGQVEDAARVGVAALHDIIQGQAALVDGGEQQRQGGFQAGETGRRVGAVFLGKGVRGMVGGKAVDHVQVVPQGLLVFGGSQARAHFSAPAAGDRRRTGRDGAARPRR